MRRRYAADPDFKRRHRIRTDRNNEKYKAASKELVRAFKANGCVLCPEKEHCSLSAHHLDPSKKSFDLAKAVGQRKGIESVRKELEKCVCLCFNCHAKVHAGLLVV